jgi:hypothetical protein
MSLKRHLLTAVIGCLLMLTRAGAWGQATASASLGGLVADKTGAVIPKAEVSITNKETGATWQAQAQDAKTPYPSMAPLEQYLMERNAEIALARSAAPGSISQDADVMVLGRHGYETAIQGRNGFVCMVERSWTSPIDDPEFWNPKGRAPICLNAAAARSYLARTIKKTNLVLAGRTKAQMIETIAAAVDKGELPAMETGAMCYMLSKQGYLSDLAGHWHPHLMFFVSQTDPAAWAAGMPGSPIFAFNDTWEHLTIFLVPVRQWSDGTADFAAN